MPFTLAILQTGAESNSQLYIMLGIVTLLALFALGLKLFTNMFEVFTSPGASLAHLGRTDNFLFSLTLILLAGLIGTFILVMKQPEMVSGFHEMAQQLSDTAAQGNASANYRQIASEMGASKLDNFFAVYVAGNLIFYPVIALVHWLLFGIIWFGIVRLLGGHCTAGGFLGTIAYGYFFGIIGSALQLAGVLPAIKDAVGGTYSPDVLSIIGGLLVLYSLILVLIGANQAGELGAGRLIASIVIMLILIGGMQYGIYSMTQKPFAAWSSEIRGYDPSKGSYGAPAGGGAAAAPAGGATKAPEKSQEGGPTPIGGGSEGSAAELGE